MSVDKAIERHVIALDSSAVDVKLISHDDKLKKTAIDLQPKPLFTKPPLKRRPVSTSRNF